MGILTVISDRSLCTVMGHGMEGVGLLTVISDRSLCTGDGVWHAGCGCTYSDL